MKKQVFSFETRKEADGFSAGVAAVLPPDQYRIVTRTVWSRSCPHEVTLIRLEPETMPRTARITNPASLSAAREEAWQVCEVSPGQIRDDGWTVEQLKAWLFEGCEAYAAALSGEPPAPTPEPATCPKCAGVGGDAGGTACDLCGGTGRAPAAPTAATPHEGSPRE